MMTSTFTTTQVAAVFITAILTICPPSSSPGCSSPSPPSRAAPGVIGTIWPTTYYMHASLGAYTKGLGPGLMIGDVLFLAGCIPVLLAISVHRPEEAGEVGVRLARSTSSGWASRRCAAC